jgi:hypothetical protein
MLCISCKFEVAFMQRQSVTSLGFTPNLRGIRWRSTLLLQEHHFN